LHSKYLAASAGLLAALALGVTACGGDDSDSSSGGTSSSGGGEAAGKQLTIYSSVPLQGASRVQTTAVVNGAKLALEQAGNKAGAHTIKYEPLDDSTAQAGNWTPEQESSNARKAAQDDSTAVYLGTFNSGAAAVSIPILNEAGIPMISPANTAVGLTTNQPGSNPGEPDKYYPAGTRNYTRIVPKDTIQGAALATVMKEDGCTKVQLTNDKEVYGAGLASNIELAAKAQGLTIISNEAIDKNAANYRSLAQKAKGAGADCFVYAGITANNAVQLYKDFAAALPDAKGLYGPDGVAESGFVDPKEGGAYLDWGPHGCDTLRWFTSSEATVAFGLFSNFGDIPAVDPSAMVTYGMASGAMAQLWMSYEIPAPGLGSYMQWLCVGDNGMLDFTRDVLRVGQGDAWRTELELPPWDWSVDPKAPRRSGLTARQGEGFARSLRDGTPPEVSGRDGRAAIEMVEAAIASARSGQAVPIVG